MTNIELDTWQSGQIRLLAAIEQVEPETLIDRMIAAYQEKVAKANRRNPGLMFPAACGVAPPTPIATT